MTAGDIQPSTPTAERSSSMGAGRSVLIVVAWLWVLIPFLYGVIALLGKIGALF